MTTMDLVSQDPASVLILHSCLMGIALQCLGRHLRLINLDVDPGSNSTFSKVQDLTAEMVSTTIILVGLSRFLLGILTSGTISPISASTGATSQLESAKSRGSLNLPVLLDPSLLSSSDPSNMAMVRLFFLVGGLSLARLREVGVMLMA